MTQLIKTSRLVLRQWQDKDRPEFANMVADAEVMKYFPSTLTRKQSDAAIDRFSHCIDSNGWGFWAAESRDTNRFIGFVGINDNPEGLPFSPCVDIGWRLRRDEWGKGLATEGACAALAHAFLTANLPEVVAMTPLLNLASERVMQKLGMNKRRSNFMHPALQPGHELEEHVLYSLSRSEYLNQTVSSPQAILNED
jgi:RimJ/RimL family protein N-acetyltransferase